MEEKDLPLKARGLSISKRRRYCSFGRFSAANHSESNYISILQKPTAKLKDFYNRNKYKHSLKVGLSSTHSHKSILQLFKNTISHMFGLNLNYLGFQGVCCHTGSHGTIVRVSEGWVVNWNIQHALEVNSHHCACMKDSLYQRVAPCHTTLVM